jgi:hypothetical protein
VNLHRIAAAVALTATLIGGSATAASAHAPSDRLSHAIVHQADDVQICIDALEYTRVPSDQPQSDLDDRAVIMCAMYVDTKPEAKRLYRWAHRPAHRWALALIG